jgi:hypothetical protein
MFCNRLLLGVLLLTAGGAAAGGGAVDRLASHHRQAGGRVRRQGETLLDLLHPRGGVIVADGPALPAPSPMSTT